MAGAIQHLHAVRIPGPLGSGRTRPALCDCAPASGGETVSYVVKLRVCLDLDPAGSAFELLASLLAQHFGIATPAPAVVGVAPVLLDAVAERWPRPACVRASAGLNFGSELIVGGTTLPVGAPLPDTTAAAAIYAFDALIANPDRRPENPNLLLRGEQIIVIDHEAALAFGMYIGGAKGYIPGANHALYKRLKGKNIDLQGFTSGLARLTSPVLDQIYASLPEQWNNELVAHAREPLLRAAANAGDFIEQIRRSLR